MNKKYIEIFDYINRQDWNQGQWGFYTNADGSTIRQLFGPGFASNRYCPENLLYAWIGDDDADEMLGKLKSDNYPDIHMTSKEGETLLIWDLRL